MFFLVYFCVHFFTRLFHACFSCGICVQYGGFPHTKQACNAAMPMACTVGELLAKNIEKTARRQLEGQHLLFGEYLRS